MAIKKKITFEGNTYNLGNKDRVSAFVAAESQYVEKVALVDNTTAFVQNSDSEVTWTQPANTVITAILGMVVVAPVTAASADLGVEVGTASGAGQIVAQDADLVIDAAADGTDAAVGGFVGPLTLVNTTDDTELAAYAAYASSARTVYLNTVTSNHSVTTAGTFRWIIKYVSVSND